MFGYLRNQPLTGEFKKREGPRILKEQIDLYIVYS